MKIQESGEMYLETILILRETNDKVRAIDVGSYMGFSKPSVSRALGILKEAGFVTVDDKGNLDLTESGTEIARKIYERHTVLSEVLEKLGVPKDIAIEDACKMEHDLSDESFNAITRWYNERK